MTEDLVDTSSGWSSEQQPEHPRSLAVSHSHGSLPLHHGLMQTQAQIGELVGAMHELRTQARVGELTNVMQELRTEVQQLRWENRELHSSAQQARAESTDAPDVAPPAPPSSQRSLSPIDERQGVDGGRPEHAAPESRTWGPVDPHVQQHDAKSTDAADVALPWPASLAPHARRALAPIDEQHGVDGGRHEHVAPESRTWGPVDPHAQRRDAKSTDAADVVPPWPASLAPRSRRALAPIDEQFGVDGGRLEDAAPDLRSLRAVHERDTSRIEAMPKPSYAVMCSVATTQEDGAEEDEEQEGLVAPNSWPREQRHIAVHAALECLLDEVRRQETERIYESDWSVRGSKKVCSQEETAWNRIGQELERLRHQLDAETPEASAVGDAGPGSAVASDGRETPSSTRANAYDDRTDSESEECGPTKASSEATSPSKAWHTMLKEKSSHRTLEALLKELQGSHQEPLESASDMKLARAVGANSWRRMRKDLGVTGAIEALMDEVQRQRLDEQRKVSDERRMRLEDHVKVLQRSSLQLLAKAGRQPSMSRHSSTLTALSDDSGFDT